MFWVISLHTKSDRQRNREGREREREKETYKYRLYLEQRSVTEDIKEPRQMLSCIVNNHTALSRRVTR